MSEQSIDPRIVHVASELSVSLGPQAENDGNMEYILDVIAAVDYANETCDRDFVAGVKAAREAVAAAYEGHFTENGVLYRDADPATGLRALDALIDALEKP